MRTLFYQKRVAPPWAEPFESLKTTNVTDIPDILSDDIFISECH